MGSEMCIRDRCIDSFFGTAVVVRLAALIRSVLNFIEPSPTASRGGRVFIFPNATPHSPPHTANPHVTYLKRRTTGGATKNSEHKNVGITGFEPATPRSQSECATKLRHIPILARHSSDVAPVTLLAADGEIQNGSSPMPRPIAPKGELP